MYVRPFRRRIIRKVICSPRTLGDGVNLPAGPNHEGFARARVRRSAVATVHWMGTFRPRELSTNVLLGTRPSYLRYLNANSQDGGWGCKGFSRYCRSGTASQWLRHVPYSSMCGMVWSTVSGEPKRAAPPLWKQLNLRCRRGARLVSVRFSLVEHTLPYLEQVLRRISPVCPKWNTCIVVMSTGSGHGLRFARVLATFISENIGGRLLRSFGPARYIGGYKQRTNFPPWIEYTAWSHRIELFTGGSFVGLESFARLVRMRAASLISTTTSTSNDICAWHAEDRHKRRVWRARLRLAVNSILMRVACGLPSIDARCVVLMLSVRCDTGAYDSSCAHVPSFLFQSAANRCYTSLRYSLALCASSRSRGNLAGTQRNYRRRVCPTSSRTSEQSVLMPRHTNRQYPLDCIKTIAYG